MELIREFVQELHRTSAAEAWQRCVEVAKELPLEPALEPRVKLKKDATEIPTAGHPFFWAGYLLVDCGEPLLEDAMMDPAAQVPAADAAKDAPKLPPQVPPQAQPPAPAK